MRLTAFLSARPLWISRLALMGPPGAGKTSVGRLLADALGVQFIDMDDDILQPSWGTTVANELKRVGNSNFIKREGQTAMNFNLPQTFVLALSGSNPLYSPFMDKLKQSTLRVFLDIDSRDIIARLERMKVDRIVSHDESMTMNEILDYRRSFYEGNYDVRVLCGTGDSEEVVLDRVMSELQAIRHTDRHKLVSTRAESSETSNKTFRVAISEGLAPDGGLYVPKSIPKLSLNQWERMVNMSYAERALRILEQLISRNDIERFHLKRLIDDAFCDSTNRGAEVCPIVHLHGNVFIQELFHGPTASFKDLALQLAARLLPHVVQTRQVIVVATSGDTGSAVLNAFKDTKWPVVVMYPKHGVSSIQELCMTQFHDGVRMFVCGVDADFDFCQSAIKTLFQTNSGRCHEGFPVLNGVNSINWGRLIPQIVYHCCSYLDLVKRNHIAKSSSYQVVIPTGNLGNALSAFYAKQMGIPISKIVVASNENDIVHEFFSKGLFDLRNRKLLQTPSPAIDILRPSNLERLIHCFDPRLLSLRQASFATRDFMQADEGTMSKVQQTFISGSAAKETYMPHISRTLGETGYLMDPHTAVASVVLKDLEKVSSRLKFDDPTVICATAHPAKFAHDVLESLEISAPSQPSDAIRKLNSISKRGPEPHQGLNTLRTNPNGKSSTWTPSDVNDVVEKAIDGVKNVDIH